MAFYMSRVCNRLSKVGNQLFPQRREYTSLVPRVWMVMTVDAKWHGPSGRFYMSCHFRELGNDRVNAVMVRRMRGTEEKMARWMKGSKGKTGEASVEEDNVLLQGIYEAEQNPAIDGLLLYVRKVFNPVKHHALIIQMDNKSVAYDLISCLSRSKPDIHFRNKPGCILFRQIKEEWNLRVEIQYFSRSHNTLANAVVNVSSDSSYFHAKFVNHVLYLDGADLTRMLSIRHFKTQVRSLCSGEYELTPKPGTLKQLLYKIKTGKEYRPFGESEVEWLKLLAFCIKTNRVWYSSEAQVNRELIAFKDKKKSLES